MVSNIAAIIPASAVFSKLAMKKNLHFRLKSGFEGSVKDSAIADSNGRIAGMRT